MERAKLTAISALHFLIDIYSGFFPVYLVIAGLDPVAAATISAVATFVGNAVQPFLGYLSDRIRGKLPVFAGILVGSVCMSCIGLTDDYGALFVLLLLGKLGISLFHPAGASISGAAGRSRREFGFSVFTTIGTLGYALSHPTFSLVTAAIGTRMSYLLALPGVVCAISYLLLGNIKIEGRGVAIPIAEMRRIFLTHVRELTILFLIMTLRQAFVMGISFFIAKLCAQWGFERVLYSTANTVFLFAGAGGIFLAGILAHRLRGRTILLISLTTFIPFYAAFLFFGHQGNVILSFLFLGITGFVVYSSHVANVVMGHRIVPEMTSTVSGLLMGFAWSTANFSQPLVAVLDGTVSMLPGLMSGFALITVLPLLAALLALLLPSRREATGDHATQSV